VREEGGEEERVVAVVVIEDVTWTPGGTEKILSVEIRN